MLISISHDCPFCGAGHKNKCFAKYTNGYKCFSCGKCKIADRVLMQEKSSDVKIVLPPYHSNFESYNLANKRYLYERGITPHLAYKYQIYETRKQSKILIVPVVRDCNYYVLRDVQQGFTSAKGIKPLCILGEKSTSIILVEDYLSAITLAEAGFRSMCLFGTILSNEFAKSIVSNYTTIHTWLDPDVPGQEGAENIQKRINYHVNMINRKRALSQRKVLIKNILSEKDPKYYTKTKVKEKVAQ